MKKVVTAAILVAFAGAVAFASFETTSKKVQQQKQEKKEIKKKKKECSHTCLFS